MSVFFFSLILNFYIILDKISRKEIKGNEQKSPDTKIISWFEKLKNNLIFVYIHFLFLKVIKN